MHKTVFNLFFLCALPLQLIAQVLPKEESKLNYRLIGFSFPAVSNSNNYNIQIAGGHYNNEDSFSKNVIVSLDTRKNRLIAEVPSFGQQYSWRVVYFSGHAQRRNGDIRHFAVQYSPLTDTAINRLKVMHSAEKYADAYVFLDDNKALYDMSGRPVWFLPTIDSQLNPSYQPRDIKLTQQGTITLIAIDKIYEVDYNGSILLKKPESSIVGNRLQHYHHEFTRLSDGNYLALGNETLNVYISDSPETDKTGLVLMSDAQVTALKSIPSYLHFFRKDEFGIIFEYNSDGKLVWSYRTSQYFNGSDLLYKKNSDGKMNTKVHDNSFFFDENKQYLYISFKDINRVIKVKYPEGAVVNSYGEDFLPRNNHIKTKELFCGQHAVKLSEDGDIYLFNNNDCNWPQLPTIVVLKQPASKRDSLEKIWEYQCTVDNLEEAAKKNLRQSTGGNVIELPDRSFFVSMASGYSKVFIVTQNKKLVWSALPERWNSSSSKWEPSSLYRASIVTDREWLEHLIWGGEQ